MLRPVLLPKTWHRKSVTNCNFSYIWPGLRGDAYVFFFTWVNCIWRIGSGWHTGRIVAKRRSRSKYVTRGVWRQNYQQMVKILPMLEPEIHREKGPSRVAHCFITYILLSGHGKYVTDKILRFDWIWKLGIKHEVTCLSNVLTSYKTVVSV